jgi:DNA-binding XRE family transcriptional regulator
MTKSELRGARKKLGMTQTELAEAIGMKKSAIVRMEGGQRPIMKHTELSVKYLLLVMRKKRERRK